MDRSFLPGGQENSSKFKLKDNFKKPSEQYKHYRKRFRTLIPDRRDYQTMVWAVTLRCWDMVVYNLTSG